MKATLNALSVLALVASITSACLPAKNTRSPRGSDDSGSILASVPGVDKSLGDKFDMNFKLLCANSQTDALKEVATTGLTKDQIKNGTELTVKFTPTAGNTINEGAYCAIDVYSATAASPSEFTFQPGKDNLFYATTRKLVSGKCNMEAICVRSKCGICVDDQTVSSSSPGK